MTTGPFNVKAVIDRVKAEVTGLRKVGGAAEIATITADSTRPPVAFVLLTSELGGPRAGASNGAYSQRLTATVSVLMGVQAYGDATGGKNPGELQAKVQALRTALLNWQPIPGNACTVMELADGRVYDFRDQVIWWLDRFRFDYFVEIRT